MQHSAQDELTAAMAAERAAWEQVKDKLPGSRGFDAALWEHWRATVGRCQALRAAMRAATPEGHGRSPHHP
jgi:hypothetical protein